MKTANKENAILEVGKNRVQKFLDQLVEKQNGCLEWSGYKNPDGYGVFSLKGKATRTHRIAYVLRYGEIQNGMVVRHSCHNPSCCNADHLMIGTQQDNIQDMLKEGRQFSELKKKPKTQDHAYKIGLSIKAYRARIKAEGKQHVARAKLANEQVEELRNLYASGEKVKNLSEKFGICRSAVYRAATKRCYLHVA